MPARNFHSVRLEVEKVIRSQQEEAARKAAVDLVDRWALEVITAHLNSSHFPLRVRAEFTVAEQERYFGTLAHELTMSWVAECNWLMRDRLRHWAKQSERFKTPFARQRQPRSV